MRSKLYLKNISAIAIIEAMTDKERRYIHIVGECPFSDEFDDVKEDFTFNQFMDAASRNNKLKKKFLKLTKENILERVYSELEDLEFCAMDFSTPHEMVKQDRISAVMYGIESIIVDSRFPVLEKYLNNEEYADKLQAFDEYLEDNEESLPLILLTAMLYLMRDREGELSDIEDALEVKLLDAYGEFIYDRLAEEVEFSAHLFMSVKEERESLTNEIKDIKEKNKALKEENSRLLRVRNQFSDILKDINKSIKDGAEVYPNALKDVNAFKKDVAERNFNSIISALTTQVGDLRIVNKELKDKAKSLEVQLEKALEEKNALSLKLSKSRGEEWMGTSDEASLTDIEEAPANTEETIDGDADAALAYRLEIKNVESKSTDNQKRPSKGRNIIIGYCEIENGVHYVVHPDGTRIEILNIRSGNYEKTYLFPGQFVKVDINGNLRHVFSFYTDKTLNGLDLVEVRYFNKDYYFRIDDEEVQVKLRKDLYLEDNMIFAVDKERNIRSLFKHIRNELDFYEESIKAKGHKIFYVLKKMSKGVMTREVFSGEEGFMAGSFGDIDAGELMVLDKRGNYIYSISNNKMYTRSSYYTLGKEAFIVDYEGKSYFKLKDSGELIRIKKSSKTLEIGDMVILDEFNNILKYPEEIRIPKEYKENKKAVMEKPKLGTEEISITHRALILGDPAFSNNYKLSFYKKGYIADVINGFDSYSKVSLKLKDYDCVILISNHVSHNNMWRIKEGGYSVIYSSSDGANRVLEQFEEFLGKSTPSTGSE